MNLKTKMGNTIKYTVRLSALLMALILSLSLISCENNGKEQDDDGGSDGNVTENGGNTEQGGDTDNSFTASEPNDPYENDKHWELP